MWELGYKLLFRQLYLLHSTIIFMVIVKRPVNERFDDKLIQSLIDADGISGNEGEIRKLILKEIRGNVDKGFIITVDLFLTFPTFFLLLALVSYVNASAWVLIVIISITNSLPTFPKTLRVKPLKPIATEK